MHQPTVGQSADSITTAVAFNRGYVEGNPILSGLSIWHITALKFTVTQAFKFTPEPICKPALTSLTFTGYSAALWNIGVMMGSGPAAIPLMLGLTWWRHKDWWQNSAAICADPFPYTPFVEFPSSYTDMLY